MCMSHPPGWTTLVPTTAQAMEGVITARVCVTPAGQVTCATPPPAPVTAQGRGSVTTPLCSVTASPATLVRGGGGLHSALSTCSRDVREVHVHRTFLQVEKLITVYF